MSEEAVENPKKVPFWLWPNVLGLDAPPKPLDVTDALSLALAYLHRGRTLASLAHRSSKSRLTR